MFSISQFIREVVEGKSPSLLEFISQHNCIFAGNKNIFIKNSSIAFKSIYAKKVYIKNSKVKTDIYANEVYISDNSDVTGRIESKIIKIEDGCVFNGSGIIK